MRLFFQDEGRFGRINNIQKCWFKKGARPYVKHQLIREFIYAYGSVCPQTGEIYSMIMPFANAGSMQYYIDEMAKHYKRYRIVLCMDNAAWHTADQLTMPENMTTWFLPPYSPELNPAEMLWKHIRSNYFNNQCFETLVAVEDELCKALKDMYKAKKQMSSLTYYGWMK